MTIEEKYKAYRRELKKLNEWKDAWYTIASQKFSEGDKDGQERAYLEVTFVQEKISQLVNPLEEI